MKTFRPFVFVLGLALCACSKSHDSSDPASPVVASQPPIVNPTCGTVSWSKQGTIRGGNGAPGSGPGVMTEKLPSVNMISLAFSFKEVTAATWQVGWSKGRCVQTEVEFAVSGATVTITNCDSDGYNIPIENDWAIAGTYQKCS